MKRNDYQPVPKHDYVSTKNEPFSWNDYTVNVGPYPDMYAAYHAFSEHFQIPMENFILTNGCENAARWALLFFRGEKIHLESPTWGLMKVLCEAFNMDYDEFPYHYDEESKRFYAKDVPEGVLYTTSAYNNLFKHDPVESKRGIVDETYTLDTLQNKDRKLEKNKVVIGSFSKFAGCGLRLGYVLFHETHNDFFQMMREQYINAAAVEFLKRSEIDECLKWPGTKPLSGEAVTIHPTYTTYRANDFPKPHKKFVVDGITFCREGRTIYVLQ